MDKLAIWLTCRWHLIGSLSHCRRCFLKHVRLSHEGRIRRYSILRDHWINSFFFLFLFIFSLTSSPFIHSLFFLFCRSTYVSSERRRRVEFSLFCFHFFRFLFSPFFRSFFFFILRTSQRPMENIRLFESFQIGFVIVDAINYFPR